MQHFTQAKWKIAIIVAGTVFSRSFKKEDTARRVYNDLRGFQRQLELHDGTMREVLDCTTGFRPGGYQ